ncbi:hypothetical protein [Catenulispora pinisilvae]|uniref:hypothetical protein n=1 Tax=Catenulispora pinisilvae TaxID=2705253 RepID=UPI0018926AF5|nr:hypothetical protein [Catenulispora pinisilvae]
MSVEVERPPALARTTVDGVHQQLRDTAADPGARPNIVHRVLLVITAFSMFSTLMGVFGPTVRWPGVGILLFVSMCALVAVAVMGFTTQTMRWFGRAELLLAVLAVVGISLWMLSMILSFNGYRSDEEIFVQYSADLLRHGHNPYTADLTPAYAQYPSPFPTKLLDGSITHHLDYPALPTLLTTVLTMMVGTFHTVGLLCTLFLVATIVVMYVLLPRGLRSLAALVVAGIPVLAQGAVGGLLFALVVPFLAFAAYRWKQTGAGGRLSKLDVAKAVAVGAAISTTQVAWFPIPFLFLGIFLVRRGELGRRGAAIVTAKYIAVSAATFLVINVPFIVWSPGGWLRGALAPLTQHAVPEGEGLINLVQSMSTGSGNLSLYTYAGALVMIGLLVAYWRHFDRLGSACFALPMIGLLFPTRSYWTYFIAYAAAWVVGLLTNDLAPVGEKAEEDEPAVTERALLTPRVPWLSRYAAITVAAFVPAVAVFGVAVASPAPMTLKVDSYLTSAQLNTVQTVTVTATNHSDHTLTPHFMAVHGNGMVSASWNVVSGPKVIKAHSWAQYVVTAPSTDAMPLITDALKIQAVTDSPATVSYSGSVNPQPYTTVLVADSPALPLLPPGSSIVLNARVQSQFGTELHRTGIRVCLGQTKFTNASTDYDTASVTASPTGDQASCGFTDSQGEVHFTVTSHGTDSRQLYFQSYGMQGSLGRFGYSTFLSAAWR